MISTATCLRWNTALLQEELQGALLRSLVYPSPQSAAASKALDQQGKGSQTPLAWRRSTSSLRERGCPSDIRSAPQARKIPAGMAAALPPSASRWRLSTAAARRAGDPAGGSAGGCVGMAPASAGPWQTGGVEEDACPPPPAPEREERKGQPSVWDPSGERGKENPCLPAPIFPSSCI